MVYRFEVKEVAVKKGALSAGDRRDLMEYLASMTVEAADGKKAFRAMADHSNAVLNRGATDEEASMTFPDYGGCRITLAAVTV